MCIPFAIGFILGLYPLIVLFNRLAGVRPYHTRRKAWWE